MLHIQMMLYRDVCTELVIVNFK